VHFLALCYVVHCDSSFSCFQLGVLSFPFLPVVPAGTISRRRVALHVL